MKKTIETTWELWTYDVWGNAQDGYEVNDRSCDCREYPIRLKVEVYNVGTPQQFEGASPSDYQIKKAFSVGCAIETDGDDTAIYVNRASDGYPIGEMFCTSHDSLSPIRGSKETEEKEYICDCGFSTDSLQIADEHFKTAHTQM